MLCNILLHVFVEEGSFLPLCERFRFLAIFSRARLMLVSRAFLQTAIQAVLHDRSVYNTGPKN